MDTVYQYIVFEKDPNNFWYVFNRKHNIRLGTVEYHKTWHQWCFYPNANTLFSMSCLEDIIKFTKQLKGEK